MSNYNFFSKGPSQWGEAFQLLWEHHDICPVLEQFHVTSITQSELASLTSLKAWDNLEKFQSNVTFLLVLTEECTVGDRVYGLSMVWVNPYEARVSTMEEEVKQLAPLIPTGPDWPHTLVQLNTDTCHVSLPKERHLSILVEGGTSSAACGWISQLYVHQLQSATKKQESKALSPGGHSIPILTTSPIRAPLPKAEGWDSMTAEVRELLSQVVLDTSGQASGGSTPKRLEAMALVTPIALKPEAFPKPGDTSSQVGALDEGELDDPTQGVPATYSPTIKTPGPSGDVPPLDIAHLWEEANKALGDWLANPLLMHANGN